jgi:hypothetical protein
MNALRVFAILLAGISFLVWCGPSGSAEPTNFTVTTKQIGFPIIDTEITFTRESERIYRVRYSNLPPIADLAMLYTGFYFCAARKLALEFGFDRTALVADPDSPQSGVAAFLRPGESPSVLSDQRFASVTMNSIELFAATCPTQPPPAKQ